MFGRDFFCFYKMSWFFFKNRVFNVFNINKYLSVFYEACIVMGNGDLVGNKIDKVFFVREFKIIFF